MKHYLCYAVMAAVLSVLAIACESETTTSTGSTTMTCEKSSLVVPYDGGVFRMRVKVNNPVDDGELIISSEEPWVYGFDLSIEDTLAISVAYSEEREVRRSDVSIDYLSGTDTLVSRTITVIQEWNSRYDFEPSVAVGHYYGESRSYSSAGSKQSVIYLSDKPLQDDWSPAPGATCYILDLWSSAGPDGGGNYVTLPEGEYAFGEAGGLDVVSDDSRFIIMDEEGEDYEVDRDITGGTLIVSRVGGETEISAELEDSEGGVHYLTYYGDLNLENDSLLSTLDSDLEFGDFSSVACEAIYYGDYYSAGTANWVLNIYPEDGTGFTIDYCSDTSYTYEGGSIPVGTFAASTAGGTSGTFLTGSLYVNYINGTWLVTLDGNGSLTEPYAPLTSGTITVSSVSSGTYTVAIDASDDRGNKITASWTGTPALSDYSMQTRSNGPESRKWNLSLPCQTGPALR